MCFRGVFHHRVLASQLDQPIVSSSVQHQEHEHRLPRHKTHAAPVGSVGVVDGCVCVCCLGGVPWVVGFGMMKNDESFSTKHVGKQRCFHTWLTLLVNIPILVSALEPLGA